MCLWPEDMDIFLDKILMFCFGFLFCELKLFHESSYIQTNIKWRGLGGGGDSEFAWVFFKIPHLAVNYMK